MHATALRAVERKGNYWHMLPEYAQGRKAIWDAINPDTGHRRIDEAFPPELRKRVDNQGMSITLLNGSTWQVVGSDSYDSLVGSPPVGIVFSEWALCKPMAWSYLSPILAANGGFALFISTPRGRNHAHAMHTANKDRAGWFTQLLTVADTGVLSAAQLVEAKRDLQAVWGEEGGNSLYQQEYFCSFDAPLAGAIFGEWIGKAERDGRITSVPYDPALPVFTAWDIGYDDYTSIWFFQLLPGEVRFIDFYESNRKDVEFYCNILKYKDYKYGLHYLPHDAQPKTFAAQGRSVRQQFEAIMGAGSSRIVPQLDVMDRIQAARMMFGKMWFDKEKTFEGMEHLRQQAWKRSKNSTIDSATEEHKEHSHAAAALCYAAVALQLPDNSPQQFLRNQPGGRKFIPVEVIL